MKVVIADDIRGVFNDLQRLAPTVIAGGYLRDMIHGVKFNDVDFIVDGKPDLTGFVGYWSGGYYGDAGCERIIDVFKGNTAHGTRFDVICVKGNYQDHIDNFDFGINQVWWDGQLHVTKKFVADHLTETLNFTKPEYDIRTTRNRGKRIAEKLGFTFQGVKYEKLKPREELIPGDFADPQRQYMVQRGWRFLYGGDGGGVDNVRPVGQPIVNADWAVVEQRAAQQQVQQAVYRADALAADYWRQQALADMQYIAEWHTQQMQQVRRPTRIEYAPWRDQDAVDRANQARLDHEERARRMAETYRRMYAR